MVDIDKKAIVFIDGNNLYHNVKWMNLNPKDIDLAKLSKEVCDYFLIQHKKTVYYNSTPNIEDGKSMYWGHMKFLEDVAKIPRFKVKTRKLQKNSTAEIRAKKKANVDSLGLCKTCGPLVETNCNDCVGNVKRREKGIDILIAVDMLHLSVIKKQCDACILISGDADFIPALNLVKSNGIKAFSASVTKGYSYELRKENKHFIMSRDFLRDRCFKD